MFSEIRWLISNSLGTHHPWENKSAKIKDQVLLKGEIIIEMYK
jgi:hypothetical protein